ncbi:ankyrin repeat-containing domain protein [Hyaloscypha finlandica]|nr:ankyrin repeat-containing domain protein [Hyaloscypha finlandica]
MAVYKYQPIDLDGPTIRLLRLLKGDFTADIQCELFEGWINQSEGGMPYNALSYTWGSTEKAATITVNSGTMHVTFNLHAALQHLRFQNEDRILWIDAICINQDNREERRHQVQLMSYIYKEAEEVIIWLGQGTKESDFIMDAMKRLQETNVNIEGDWRHLAKEWMRSWSVIQATLGDRNISQNGLREGMESMLRRPWFRRIWILQEIANARVAIVLCGNKSISARIFAQVPSLIGLQPQPHCQAVLDIMPGLSRKESWWGQSRNLQTLLVKFRESEATDERDIIYALLGISTDACRSNILVPDYAKSLQQVIRDTTVFLLSHSNQDSSYYKSLDWMFLNWTLPEFLRSLDSLNSAILTSASENGQEAVVKLLLATGGVEVNWKGNDGGWTPLLRAAKNGHYAVVYWLLENGAELESKDMNGQTSLSWAAKNGHYNVTWLLLEKGADLESKDKSRRKPLSFAAENGHEDVVKLLLENAAELKTKDSLYGETPLCWAVRNGHEAVVRLLLDTDAEIELKYINWQTLLSVAYGNGHEAIVRLLHKKAAKLGMEVD